MCAVRPACMGFPVVVVIVAFIVFVVFFLLFAHSHKGHRTDPHVLQFFTVVDRYRQYVLSSLADPAPMYGEDAPKDPGPACHPDVKYCPPHLPEHLEQDMTAYVSYGVLSEILLRE